jgi:uncharacterized membrane protein YtjA (UPF0391 family)
MLRWALAFFVISLVAALLGFTGVAGSAANIAQILFWVFLVVFFVTLLASVVTGRRPPVQ